MYIDDVLIFTKGTFDLHLEHLGTVLKRIADASLQISLPKSHFFAERIKYLGFILTKHGLEPDPDKVKAIRQLDLPHSRHQLRSFLRLCSFIREMVPRYSELTAPLTDLLSTKKKFLWTPLHSTAYRCVQNAIAKATMLAYPDYKLPFEIVCDASKFQVGSIIAQHSTTDGPLRPIAMFAKKMTEAQHKYTIMEQEFLSIVLMLQKFRAMLYGYPLIIYTDHKNLTFNTFHSDRTTHWRLYVKEFGPTFRYLPGTKNIGADALSRLPLVDSYEPVDLVEVFELDNAAIDICPIAYDCLAKAQQDDVGRLKIELVATTIVFSNLPLLPLHK